MGKYAEIGERLRNFGRNKYSSMTDFASALDTRPQTLNNYLSGNARPGNILQQRLRSLGCDIEWLMTGETKPVDRVHEKEVEYFKSENERLKRENDALKRSLAPHIVQTVLESINYKPVRKKKQ